MSGTDNQRHVLISGGSRGIGAACARRFLEAGDRVSVLARSTPDETELPASSRLQAISADLRNIEAAAAACRQAEEQFGPIDVLVNCAGAAQQTPPAQVTAQTWQDAMAAKYFTYMNVIDPVLKRMVERRSGVIVNVIGLGGKVPSDTHLPGGAANAALMLATTGLGHAWGHAGVRVVGINPGPVATSRLRQLIAAKAANEGISEAEAEAVLTQTMPYGRVITAEEIAETVFFLASPRASAINATVIATDGGASPVI